MHLQSGSSLPFAEQIMIGGFQNASPSGVLNNHRPRSGFSDRLTLSNPHTGPCFPIKLVQQPLLLLPGAGVVLALVCVGIAASAWAVCDCLPTDALLWKDIKSAPCTTSINHQLTGKLREGRRIERTMEVTKGSGIRRRGGWEDGGRIEVAGSSCSD